MNTQFIVIVLLVLFAWAAAFDFIQFYTNTQINQSNTALQKIIFDNNCIPTARDFKSSSTPLDLNFLDTLVISEKGSK